MFVTDEDNDIASFCNGRDKLYFTVKNQHSTMKKIVGTEVCRSLSGLCEFNNGRPIMKFEADSLEIGDEVICFYKVKDC